MKVLIPILIGLLVVGCGKKELKKEDLVGTYEGKLLDTDHTQNRVLRDNGEFEWSSNHRQDAPPPPPHGKWTITKDGELHLKHKGGPDLTSTTEVWKINSDGSITWCGEIIEGARHDWSKDDQYTFKKIYKHKESSNVPARPVKKLTEEEKRLIGEYERKSIDGVTSKYVLLKNGAFEGYRGDGKAMQQWLDSKWKIVDGEIHVKIVSIREWVWRINEDGSITYIAEIWKDGQNKKRTGVPKDEQATYKKIK